MIRKGRIFDLTVATIQEDDHEYDRDIIVHGGSAVIVPVFEDMTIGFVRQYRHAAEKFLLELPAGTLEKDETPENSALREVEEEIGYKAGKLEKLTEFYVSPGFLTEKMYLFMATDLTRSKQNLDEDEILTFERIPFADAMKMIESGEIEDAKTMLGLMFAKKQLNIDS
ncbi:MAG: NUDIX hydrolase [Acidobacteria bacterium]|nr:NUDIX hydrolase [Acidobacteriota bacterium]